ncbi:hypothetical protein KJ359_005638 [Pestalotiopsis sp. 9143b]|nr:hypothetical protein KJ359_005638 [Pestalotiopsis sp. 9143b]
MGLFSSIFSLVLVALPFPALAGTSFYGPDAPCMQWMTHGNFLIANCPGREITAMTVLDLNQCYAANPDGNLVAANHGNFNTKGNCTFDPVENGSHDMFTTCPNTLKPGTNTTSLVNLGKSHFPQPAS